MTEEEKVDACIACAKSIRAKYPNPRIELDELINIGFVGISSDDKKLAYTQAYLHMLHFISHKRFPDGLVYDGATKDTRRRQDVVAADQDDLIDLDYALSTLKATERALLDMKFRSGLTTRQISEHPETDSVSHMQVARRINAIINKLRRLLGANSNRCN